MAWKQLSIFETGGPTRKTREEILASVEKLREYHKQGILGGDKMPEDANPGLDKSSKENAHYFTLPMALNYQRNSYKLWEAALATYRDPDIRFVFSPEKVVEASEEQLQNALMKYKVALQPNRHTWIWLSICRNLVENYQADVRILFSRNNYDIGLILDEVQRKRKTGFPYLSGQKIANYWLYVISQYTDINLSNRCALSIAPDTHVIQASVKLGVVESCDDLNLIRAEVADAWRKLLEGTALCPIDIHTPLWLWSRRNFQPALD